MMRNYLKPCLWAMFCFFLSTSIIAQKSLKTINPNPNAVKIALDFVSKQPKTWNLTEQDVASYYVQDSYASEHNGVTHVYLIQQHKGIELYNAIINVNILPNGEVLYAGNRFMHNLANSVNTLSPTLTPEQAIEVACKQLNVIINTPLRVKEKKSDIEFVFDKSNFVLSDINVKLRFQKINETQARLAWDLNIDQPDGKDHWSVRVDAQTGNILDKTSWTSHCAFNPNTFNHTEDCSDDPLSKNDSQTPITHYSLPITHYSDAAPLVGEGTYNVFALPVESPAHGSRSLVTNPADAAASPFGWHDTDGAAGAEYQITRGNNVHAYLDTNNDNTTDGNEPSGGTDLVFDTPFLPGGEPDTNRQAATVNLFYINNMMHDITYRYGFNEISGNFQTKNYSNVAGANDYVRAEAQDGAKLTTPTVNNANFSSPPDGSNGRMQMYIWTRPSEKTLHVTAPSNLIGDFESGTASFGPPVSTTPITGSVVIVNDGSSTPTWGCKTLLNANLSGKIALIDRGSCFFSDKIYFAQQKGAIACIVCNIEESIINMGAGSSTSNLVTIPAISIKKSDCDRIRAAVGNGLTVSINKPANSTGPNNLDGDFDNGVIAHEYGHGISSRLTGGRLNASCLSSGEQTAGEGWSDFLALAVTARPSDKGTTNRGTGTYVIRQPNDGVGLRNYPYSTDIKVNPLTYDRLIFTQEVHNVGEVWTAVLWDLYWAMVDVYGWDANLKNTQSGNGKTIQLVLDGMKLQPCNPGFLDSRDAILAADKSNYNGQNQCLIWDVFARRGMGVNADQGLSSKYNDNTEGFEKMPQCVKQIKIKKEATEYIKPGEAITYTIKVTNNKGIAASGVVVNDDFPASTTYIAGSANRNVSVSNNALTWNIGNLPNDSTIVLTYKLNSDASKKSIAQFTDDMENGERNWTVDQLLVNGDVFWQITDIESKSGKYSFGIGYGNNDSTDQLLQLKNPIKVSGTQPVLRFFHKYETESGYDGGIVQVSTDNGSNWLDVSSQIFKNPYRGLIDYTTFKLPNQKAYWGKQPTFIGSFVDLTPFIGKNLTFRFRFGTDNNESGVGWFVDDVAVMDMYNYTSKARVITAQKDTAFADLVGRGTIVEPTVFTPTNEVQNDLKVKVFPNPASDILNINIIGSEDSNVDIQILSVDGKVMYKTVSQLFGAREAVIPLSIEGYPAGIYIAKISTGKSIVVEKIVKH